MAELGQRMTASEFAHWLAFNAIEPILPGTDLQLWALHMAATSNGPMVKRDKSQWKAEDFLSSDRWAPPPPPPAATGRSIGSSLRGMLQNMRGKRVRKPRP